MIDPPKRPLRVTHVVSALEVGGLEKLVLDLVDRADRRAVTPEVVCTDFTGPLAALYGVSITTLGARPGYDWRAVTGLARHLRRKRTDILHSHNERADYLSALAARLAGVPVRINTRHGPYERPTRRAAMRLRLLGMLSDVVVAVSGVVRDAAIEADRVHADKLRVIFNGTDVSATRLPRAEARRQLDLGDHDFVIGATGRLAPEKDYVGLIEAFSRVHERIPEAMGIVLGDGPLAGDLIEAARARGLDRLRFLGYRPDAVALLPAFDVFVQPSLSEGISLSVIEAMAAGVPVIATAVGGNPEALDDGAAGVLVPARDAGALAEAVVSLARDHQRCGRLSAAGRARAAAHFSIDAIARAYEALYVEQARRHGVDV